MLSLLQLGIAFVLLLPSSYMHAPFKAVLVYTHACSGVACELIDLLYMFIHQCTAAGMTLL